MTETFSSSQEARDFVHSVNANEAESGSGSGDVGMQALRVGEVAAQGSSSALGGQSLSGVSETTQQDLASHPGTVLHPESRVEDMRKRLVELGQPVGGRKDDIWNRLSKAEAKLKEHNEKMELLRLRHEQAVENGPTIEPRVLPGPKAVSYTHLTLPTKRIV